MEERALQLLELPDHLLFAHGGCHVFALALREFFRLPLVWIHEDGGLHDHVACDGGDRHIVDVFGWVSYPEYIRAERFDDRAIRFDPIQEEEVKRRFTLVRGSGYYAHPDFYMPALGRADAWITKHREIFEGASKIVIPGLSRIQKAAAVY